VSDKINFSGNNQISIKMKTRRLKVSSPGRICLFGEHQDYLDLDVVAAAISLRLYIEGRPRNDRQFLIDLPDIGEKEQFTPDRELTYLKSRDYLRSAVNVLLRLGCRFEQGWDIRLHGEIPINAGTSSSSAMVVAWIKFLLEIAGKSDLDVSSEATAELAHQAEVLEFKEPGGKMDHYTSALGGIVWIEFIGGLRTTGLKARLGTFVLGDSLQKKDTTGTLSSVRERVNRGLKMIKKDFPDFDLKKTTESELTQMVKHFPPEIKNPLLGAIINRNLTREGLKLFQAKSFDHKDFGRLLTEEQKILDRLVGISTPKIELMLKSARESGALGGKINGSGAGGCMFAYAPEDPERVARAVEKAGGKAYVIKVDKGLNLEK
jgi:galactokinase